MSVANIGEVLYILARELSEEEVDHTVVELWHFGIEFVELDWRLAESVAHLKSKHKMSYADCFAAALAKENKAGRVTGDHEFKQVENEVRIQWI